MWPQAVAHSHLILLMWMQPPFDLVDVATATYTPGPWIVFEEAKSEAPPPLSPITGGPNELKFGTDLSWVKLHGGSLDGFDSFTGSGAIDETLENFYFIQISSKWPFILINTQEGVRILSSAGEPPCNSTQWRFMPNFSLIGPPVTGDMGRCFGSSPPQIQFRDRVYVMCI